MPSDRWEISGPPFSRIFEPVNFLHRCFGSAQRNTSALQHPPKHRHSRIARGAFFVQARRNLGKTLGRTIARRVCAKRFAGKYGIQWSFRHCRNVELFRTNAPDVAGNPCMQDFEWRATSRGCFLQAKIHMDAAPEPCRAGSLLGHGMPNRCLDSKSRGEIATPGHTQVRFQGNRRMVQSHRDARRRMEKLFSRESN